MRYLLLIYADQAEWDRLGAGEQAAIIDRHLALDEDLKRAGTYRSSDALEPTTSATTVRIRGGRALVTDGPFAETREQLGGVYLVEAQNLDAAIAIASRIPTAERGSIEIRPVREIEVRR